jgi:hypothetical protein
MLMFFFFWIATPCGLVGRYQRFGETYCFRLLCVLPLTISLISFRVVGLYLIGFKVLTAVSAKMAVLWVVAPCSLVEVYQCFR